MRRVLIEPFLTGARGDAIIRIFHGYEHMIFTR